MDMARCQRRMIRDAWVVFRELIVMFSGHRNAASYLPLMAYRWTCCDGRTLVIRKVQFSTSTRWYTTREIWNLGLGRTLGPSAIQCTHFIDYISSYLFTYLRRDRSNSLCKVRIDRARAIITIPLWFAICIQMTYAKGGDRHCTASNTRLGFPAIL